jgi:hypothetical protein
MRSTALTLKRRQQSRRAGAGRATSRQRSLMVNSVDKALKVLRAFDGSRRRLGLSQIAGLRGWG